MFLVEPVEAAMTTTAAMSGTLQRQDLKLSLHKRMVLTTRIRSLNNYAQLLMEQS
jgi:hypothetical protein